MYTSDGEACACWVWCFFVYSRAFICRLYSHTYVAPLAVSSSFSFHFFLGLLCFIKHLCCPAFFPSCFFFLLPPFFYISFTLVNTNMLTLLLQERNWCPAIRFFFFLGGVVTLFQCSIPVQVWAKHHSIKGILTAVADDLL
jgi:hypothetical protein